MELKPALVSHIASLPERNPMVFLLWKLVSETQEMPLLHLERGYLRVGAEILSLEGKQLVQRLIHLFLDAPFQRMYRRDLITHLYNPHPLTTLSWRQRECYQHNTVKLISRTRKLLQSAFPLGTQWEWLPYDASSQTWSLYRLRFCPAGV